MTAAAATMTISQQEIYYRRALAYSIFDDFHRLLKGEGVCHLPKFESLDKAGSRDSIQQVILYPNGIDFCGPRQGPERNLLFFYTMLNDCIDVQAWRQNLLGIFTVAKSIIDQVEHFSHSLNNGKKFHWSVSCIDSQSDHNSVDISKGNAKIKLAHLLNELYHCQKQYMAITIAFGRDYCVIYDC